MHNFLRKKDSFIQHGFTVRLFTLLATCCVIIYAILAAFDNISYLDFFEGIAFFFLLLFIIAPFALFFIYIYFYYDKCRASFLIPIAFAILAAKHFPGILDGGLSLIPCLISCSSCFFATIASLWFIRRKSFILLPILLSLIAQVFQFLINLRFLDFGFIYVVGNNLVVIGYILLYTAMLVFTLKNNIYPTILSNQPSNCESPNNEPAYELRVLISKREHGMISEEEYQIKRSEIIAKL